MSLLREKDFDLAFAFGWALLAVLLAATGAPVSLRSCVGIPMVLLLPGYVLTEAFLPDHRSDRSGERLALAVGLSLAVSGLGGLAINLSEIGLRTGTWTALLSGVTVLGGGAAKLRRGRPLHAETNPPGRRPSIVRLTALLVAAGAVIASLAIAERGAHQQAAKQQFAQLWMIPQGQHLTLGVRSEHRHTSNYTLTLTTRAGFRRSWKIRVGPEQRWVRRVRRPRIRPGGRVVAKLVGPGGETRTTWVWSPKERQRSRGSVVGREARVRKARCKLNRPARRRGIHTRLRECYAYKARS